MVHVRCRVGAVSVHGGVDPERHSPLLSNIAAGATSSAACKRRCEIAAGGGRRAQRPVHRYPATRQVSSSWRPLTELFEGVGTSAGERVVQLRHSQDAV